MSYKHTEGQPVRRVADCKASCRIFTASESFAPPVEEEDPGDTIVVEVPQTSHIKRILPLFLPPTHISPMLPTTMDITNSKSNKLSKPKARTARKSASLKSIDWYDGDESLRIFPEYLRHDLEKDLRRMKGRNPSCVRAFQNQGKSSTVGKESRYYSRKTGEELRVARFHYTYKFQLIVVQERRGKAFNGGRAALIVGSTGSTRCIDSNGVAWSEVRYKIWTPGDGTRGRGMGDAEVLKRIKVDAELASSKPRVAIPEIREQYRMTDDNLGVIEKPVASPRKRDAEASALKQLSRVESPRGVFVENLNHARRSLGNSESTNRAESEEPLMSQSRHLSISTHATAMTGSETSTLVPPDPQKTMAAVENHNHFSCSGCPPYAQKYDTTSLGSSQLRSSQADAQKPMTDAAFVFKRSVSSPTLRTKTLRFCNSIQQLFAHAKVAGIADSDTVMLRLSIETSEHYLYVVVVRDDPEDFEDFMTTVKDLPTEMQEVMVMPENNE